mgnify:CR=1 FL=1
METSKLINGDSLEVLKDYDENSIDLLCTDPPYGYGFMGKDSHSSIWITGEKTREHTHNLRSKVDGLLIGRNTALIDNPQLTVREVIGHNPKRIILDTNRLLPLDLKILKKYKRWKAIVIGDEPRPALHFIHKRINNLGFTNHNKVLKIFEKTSIAVACSRWNEPLGRSSLEASSRGCATIISNRGGLPETITHGVILKKLNVFSVYNAIKDLIDKPKKIEEAGKINMNLVKNQFNQNYYGKQLIKIIDNLSK